MFAGYGALCLALVALTVALWYAGGRTMARVNTDILSSADYERAHRAALELAEAIRALPASHHKRMVVELLQAMEPRLEHDEDMRAWERWLLELETRIRERRALGNW